MVAHLSSRSVPRPPIKRGWDRLTTPYALVVAVMLVLGAIVAAVAVSISDPETSTVACELSDEAQASGLQEEDASTLDGVDAAPLDQVPVRVLNANGQTGQAGQVASELGEMGFAVPDANPVGNDPLYPEQNLTCHGQIRYGGEGQSAAAALKLAAPCMQLVADGRPGNTVDLALGSYFQELNTENASKEALSSLAAGGESSEEQVGPASSEVSC